MVTTITPAGLIGLLAQFSANLIFSGTPNQSAQPCFAGQTWTFEWGAAEVLWPISGLLPANSNNHSCVLRIRFANGLVALLPGDIEESAEKALIERYGNDLAADILWAPHHGSQSSSTYAFIKRVAPRYVIVSAGYKNRFNHPHPDIVRRYHNLDAMVLSSNISGAVRFEFALGLEQNHSQVTDFKVLTVSQGQHCWWFDRTCQNELANRL